MSMVMTEKRQMLSITAANLQMEPFRREPHGEWDVTDHLFRSAQHRVHSSPGRRRFGRRWIGRQQKHRWKHHWDVDCDIWVESITETSEIFSAALAGFASQGCANFCANKRKKQKSFSTMYDVGMTGNPWKRNGLRFESFQERRWRAKVFIPLKAKVQLTWSSRELHLNVWHLGIHQHEKVSLQVRWKVFDQDYRETDSSWL